MWELGIWQFLDYCFLFRNSATLFWKRVFIEWLASISSVISMSSHYMVGLRNSYVYVFEKDRFRSLKPTHIARSQKFDRNEQFKFLKDIFGLFMNKKHYLSYKKIRLSRAVAGVTRNLGHTYSLLLERYSPEILAPGVF
jgi:hypothetical protein